MVVLKLCHPVHGLCAYQAVYSTYTEDKIIEVWKKRYGLKKFLECEVVVEGKPIKTETPKVIKKSGANQVASKNGRNVSHPTLST